MTLDDNEELIGVELTDGSSEIVLATRRGLAIRFDEQDVRPMGRTAHGVRGIQLGFDDEVVAMDSVTNEKRRSFDSNRRRPWQTYCGQRIP